MHLPVTKSDAVRLYAEFLRLVADWLRLGRNSSRLLERARQLEYMREQLVRGRLELPPSIRCLLEREPPATRAPRSRRRPTVRAS